MAFITKAKDGIYYLRKMVKTDKGWKKVVIRRATLEEYQVYQQAKVKGTEMTLMSCGNPECDNQFWVRRSQKRKFFTTLVMSKDRLNLPYCSTQCRDDHNRHLCMANKPKPKLKSITNLA